LDHVTIAREKITCAVDAKMDNASIQESLSPLMPRTRRDITNIKQKHPQWTMSTAREHNKLACSESD
jgi:hypothetical protein